MDNFYITSNLTQEKTAWNKAVADVEYFLGFMGFKPVSIQQLIAKKENYLTGLLSREKKGMVIVQYPRIFFEGFDPSAWFLGYMKTHYSNYKTVALLHDIDSIRFGEFSITNVITEVPVLNQFDYIITVNEAMASVLNEHGALPKMFPMKIFDYAMQEQRKTSKSKNKFPTVAFAGNLKYTKSQFLYDLNKIDLKSTVINLYGPYLEFDKFRSTEHVQFKGEYSPDVLPDVITEDFGLCWDGDCLDHCGGKNGEYFKYSNPHKVSFYLALGIPVIVSKDISTAAFLEKEHAGIVISSLHEMPDVLSQVTNEAYQSLQENCARVSEKLRSGYYLKHVVNNIQDELQPG